MSIRERKWIWNGRERSAWIVDYVDAKGKRRNKNFKTKREALDWNAQTRIEIKKGTHVPDADTVTIAEAGRLWLEACRNRGDDEALERSTLEHYRRHVELHIAPLIGDGKLNKLSIPAVRAFADQLRSTGRSAAQTRKVMVSLSSLVSDAMERGLIGQNPVRQRSKKRKSSTERHKKLLEAGVDIPTTDEVRAIIRAAHGRWRAFAAVACFAGLRLSELRGLAWSNIDFAAATITVRQRADAWSVIGSPKADASRRTIPVMPLVINALKEWKLACPKSDLGLVFPSEKGKVASHGDGATRAGWHALQIKAGVTTPKLDENGAQLLDKEGTVLLAPKYPGFHACRHYFVSWCAASPKAGGLGLTPKEVQVRAGHSTLAVTTDTYMHLFPVADTAEQMKAAERAFLGA
jgi:integrase